MRNTPALRRPQGWAREGASVVLAVAAGWLAAEFAAPRGVGWGDVDLEGVFLLVLVALAVGAAALLLEGFGRFLGLLSPEGRMRCFLSGLPWWAAAAFPLWKLFEGDWIREQVWRGPARGASLMLLAVIVLVWREMMGRARASRSSSGLFFALVCGIGATLCAVLDQTLLVGLYPPLHVLWLIAMVAAAASAGGLISPPWPSPLARAVMVAALVALVVVLMGFVPGRSPATRDLMLRRAVVSRKVLALLPRRARRSEGGLSIDAAVLVTRTYPHQDLLDRVIPGRRRFNVVLITVDTLRADHCGFMGDDRGLTPSLDEFAKECLIFEDAYASYPSTKFSVASLFTGFHPTVTSQASGRSSVEDAPLQLRMRTAGWQTFAETAFPPSVSTELDCLTVGWTASRNADFALGENSDRGDKVVARALKRIGGLDSASPRLFWLHLFDPHAFYVRHPGFDFGTDPAGLYAGEVAFSDREVGRFLTALKRRDDWDRTVVIIHADHGQELFERGGEGHGSTLYEEQVHVPLLIRLPGFQPRRISTPVGLVDVAPTLTHLLALDDPLPRNGRSRIPEILGDDWPDAPVELPVFFQLHEGSYGQGEMDGIRWRRFKLIENLVQGLFELYDLEADPGELRNLAIDRVDFLDELVPWLRAEQRVATRSGLLGSDEGAAESGEDLEDLVNKGYGRRAMERLRAALALGQLSTERQSGLVELLGTAGVEEARAFLISSAQSEEGHLRLAALRGLFFLDGEDIRAALLTARHHEDPATALMARKLLAIRNEGPPVISDLSRSRGKNLVIDVLAAADADAANLARELVGTGSGTGSDQAFAIRYLQKRGDPWLLAGLYSRSGFAPWPSGQTKRMAFSAMGDSGLNLVFPVVRWVFYKGGRRAREAVEKKLAARQLRADLPLMRELCRESEALLHDAMTRKSFDAVASDVEGLIGLANRAGFRDWGLVLDFIQASLFGRTSVEDLARSLESIRAHLTAGRSQDDPFIDRWIALFASRAGGAVPQPHAEALSWDREPTDGVWRGLVRLELDADGGGLIPLGQAQGAGLGFSLSDSEGKPIGQPSAAWLSWDGLLPGESRLFLLTASIPEGGPSPAHLHFVPFERGRPLGKPVTILLRP